MAEDQEKKAETDDRAAAPSGPDEPPAGPDEASPVGESVAASDDAGQDRGADDHGADDHGADDRGADDHEADDAPESTDDGDAEQADEANEPGDEADADDTKRGARMKKTGRKKKGPEVTAGQRLAAAKAAKAAKKAALRGRDAEIMEDKATERAEQASQVLEGQRNRILAAIAAVAVVAAGYFGWQAMSRSTAAEAAALLWEAEQTESAAIRAEGEGENDEDADEASDEETYPTEAARAEAALEKFRAVLSEHPSSAAAVYAQIGVGRCLAIKGEWEDSRSAYEAALASHGDDTMIAARAIEGIAFTYEAEERWDDAKERYEELGNLQGAEYELLSKLHLARLMLQQDQEDPAKAALQDILAKLGEEDAPDLPYIKDQAELALMGIDSSLVQRSSGATMGMPGMPGMEGLGGAGGQQFTPEQIQELIQKLQAEGGAGGGG